MRVPDIEVTCLLHPSVKEMRRGPTYVVGDLKDLSVEHLKGLLNDQDTVIHMAGIIHPKRIQDLYDVNYLGTEKLLRASELAEVKEFIYISSNSAYGTNPHHDIPMNEDSPLNPYMAYGRSKALAEMAVRRYWEKGAFETTTLIPTWYYGPNQPERQTRLFRMIRDGKAIISGNGYNLRSMTFIDHLCQAILLSLGRSSGEKYWISDYRPYPMIEIYSTIAELLGVSLKVRTLPKMASKMARIADSFLQRLGKYSQDVHVLGELDRDIYCSVKKAMKDLHYNPSVPFYHGMRFSIEWCRERGLL
jgi:nucleoside-diphosphate-sugar epimerase